jgi:hypothetical protein
MYFDVTLPEETSILRVMDCYRGFESHPLRQFDLSVLLDGEDQSIKLRPAGANSLCSRFRNPRAIGPDNL